MDVNAFEVLNDPFGNILFIEMMSASLQMEIDYSHYERRNNTLFCAAGKNQDISDK